MTIPDLVTLGILLGLYYLITGVSVGFLPEKGDGEIAVAQWIAWFYIGWVPVVFCFMLYRSSRYMGEWLFMGFDIPYNWKKFLEVE